MEFLKYQLKSTPKSSKPPIHSHREVKIQSKEVQCRPPRCRTISISSEKTDTRPTSISPSLKCIPLSLVSCSNVSITAELQLKLLKNTNKRKVLANIINNKTDFRQNISDKLETKRSNQHLEVINPKECTFGLFTNGKENNYVGIYNKQKFFREKKRGCSEEVIRCLSKLKNAEELLGKSKEKLLFHDMDSLEIEKRYKKITSQLDKISKNIQDLIGSQNKISY